MPMGEQSIVFFDGVCGLCNRTVDFVLREDRERIFLYSPLQGETFRRIARDHPKAMTTNSIFVLRRGTGQGRYCFREVMLFFTSSTICQGTAGWGGSGKNFPHRSATLFYQLIAATRYQVWGKRNSCRLPSPEERARFLP